jgi:hypothetical protein
MGVTDDLVADMDNPSQIDQGYPWFDKSKSKKDKNVAY